MSPHPYQPEAIPIGEECHLSLNESIVEDAALEWSCLRAGTHRQIGDPPQTS
jgi:hypothetical protein